MRNYSNTYEELQQSRAGDFHRFWHAPAHETPPGGESFVAVVERVSRAIHQLVESYPGEDIIVVAHGGTIRAALALALGLDPEASLAFTIENCSITRIDRLDGPGDGPRLSRRDGKSPAAPTLPSPHAGRGERVG